MCRVVTHDGPEDFLIRAESWLGLKEDEHNLILSLAYAHAAKSEGGPDTFFATVQRETRVVGCALRTPPHGVLITDMPPDAGAMLASELAKNFAEIPIPTVLGPMPAVESVAMAWVALRGGGWRPGLEQRIYRLDEVRPHRMISGRLRLATLENVDLAVAWGHAFAKEVGAQFATSLDSVLGWISQEALYLWEDEGAPVSIAVARGRTGRGVRIGYVYTPPERRRCGYASACVAAVSRRMLDSGLDFCVLYTDASNPTSNAIYQRIGYEAIADVQAFDLIPEGVW